jgi:hypothetical protein
MNSKPDTAAVNPSIDLCERKARHVLEGFEIAFLELNNAVLGPVPDHDAYKRAREEILRLLRPLLPKTDITVCSSPLAGR